MQLNKVQWRLPPRTHGSSSVPSWASGPASEIPAAIPLLVTWPANLAELVVPVDLALQKKWNVLTTSVRGIQTKLCIFTRREQRRQRCLRRGGSPGENAIGPARNRIQLTVPFSVCLINWPAIYSTWFDMLPGAGICAAVSANYENEAVSFSC
jgi:hypothetical protein